MCAYSRFARAASGLALLGAFSLLATPVRAIDLLDGDLQVHGFFSLTLVNTSDNNFFGQSDDRISNNFSEVGLNFFMAADAGCAGVGAIALTPGRRH